MQCKLCKREAQESKNLCGYHAAAQAALRKGYERWSAAFPGLSWNDYLNRVKTAGETGQWIRDVITLEEGGT